MQTHIAPDNGETRLIEFAETRLPPQASAGLSLDPNDVSCPFFGERLDRHVVFVPSTASVPRRRRVARARSGQGTAACPWQLVIRTTDGFPLYRR